MQNLKVEATAKTPSIFFEGDAGKLLIEGRSIPVDAEAFWTPILNWLDTYLENPQAKTIVTFDIEYLNISSSKRILFFLYKLNDAFANGLDISIDWKFKAGDEHIMEVGEDYAFMVKVPFKHLPYEEPEMAMAI